MSFLDKILALNNYNKSNKIPIIVDKKQVGRVKKEFLDIFLESKIFILKDGYLSLDSSLNSFENRTLALKEFANFLLKKGIVSKILNEPYPFFANINDKPVAIIDRALSTILGTLSFGQHLNGYVKSKSGLKMWIATRAKNKGYSGGMLDHLVAGGLPLNISLQDNLAKEALEEANIDKNLISKAKSVGVISYWYEYELGGKQDIIYCYDLELEESFIPKCNDNEVEKFELMDINEVANIVENRWLFKPNCNLVVIDFLIRHGVIKDTHKEYISLVQGLRRFNIY